MRRIVPQILILLTMSVGVGSAVPELFALAPQFHRDTPPPDPAIEKMRKSAEKKRNEQRQSALKHDTDELFKLATELKNSVDGSNEHVLSLEVIRKTEQIEKLARSVRDKMKAEGYSSSIPE